MRSPMSGATATHRNPARNIGLTNQHTVFLPRYWPSTPPRIHIGIVEKMLRLASQDTCSSDISKPPSSLLLFSWGMATPVNPAAAPRDMLRVYTARLVTTCLLRLAWVVLPPSMAMPGPLASVCSQGTRPLQATTAGS